MSLKENINYIKEEISTEEKFLEGLIRAESWYKRYKNIFILIIVVAVCSFLGYRLMSWYQEEKRFDSFMLYSEALKEQQGGKKWLALQETGSTLYDFLLLSTALKTHNQEDLKQLSNSKDGFIAAFSAYEESSLKGDISGFDVLLKRENLEPSFKYAAMLQKAYLLLEENRIQEAHQILLQIPQTSGVYSIAQALKHYGVIQMEVTQNTDLQSSEVNQQKEGLEGIEIAPQGQGDES
ncbi:hypothetical protein CCZ01_01755 [Helicobacter monodelphidis]|uniref:hypothetical protein n=1 Tax=Helicobacter sp. 15-1451 TaxID=2004995 RepID=UPI000DCCB0B7|nr:hypothetical protein [Helicobacter sp. 15-1451]RAX58941.1 hypothetical protein CCZ01_01755 [Helicobacter sp. 15-1451]